MMIFLIGVIFGVFNDQMITRQIDYCECFRADFKLQKCEKYESREQGSCHQ